MVQDLHEQTQEKLQTMQIQIKGVLLAILLAILLMPLQAQKKGYLPGHIITLEGDTLTGLVRDRSSGAFTELYPRIRFKAGNAAFRRKYSPYKIQGYTCNDQVYESVALQEESSFFSFRYPVNAGHERVFLRLIARDEPLTYYHWEYVDEDSNYLDYIPLFYLDGSDSMVRVTQGILGLKRKRLVEYFGDCPQLIEAIENKKLSETNEVYDFYVKHYVDPQDRDF